MLKIQRRQHGHPAALGNPAQPRIPALDLQPRIPTVQWPQDPELLHGSLTQIRTMSQITDPRPQFPSTVKRTGPPFEIQRGLVGIQRRSRRRFSQGMAALCPTAAAAAAAASRCRSRCELRRAAGSYRRAGLVRRAQAAGSSALLPAARGGTGCLEGRRRGCIDVFSFAAFAAAGRGCRGYEANIAASAASLRGRAGSRRWWLRLPCIGMRKHVQKVSRSSPPCPPHPCPRLLPIRTSPAAAVLSLHRAAPQVQLDRPLDRVPHAQWRRLTASERASRPCC